MSKKKARKNSEAEVENEESLTTRYLPSDAELAELKQSYSSLLKCKHTTQVLDVVTYRVCESFQNFYIVKSLNSKKPAVAILPKCLLTSFGVARPFEMKDFSFEAVTIAHKSLDDADYSLAVVCAKPELLCLKEEFKFTESERSFVALVESVSSKQGVSLRFASGVTKQVALRDISSPEKVTDFYTVGQVVRTALNKGGKLSLKRTVVDHVDPKAGTRDNAALLLAFDRIQSPSGIEALAIGAKVHGKV